MKDLPKQFEIVILSNQKILLGFLKKTFFLCTLVIAMIFMLYIFEDYLFLQKWSNDCPAGLVSAVSFYIINNYIEQYYNYVTLLQY